jgi:FdhD protein
MSHNDNGQRTDLAFPDDTALAGAEPLVAASAPIAYLEWADGALSWKRKPVIRETPWTLVVNGQHWLTLLCTPTNLRALILGFLFNEGIIQGLDDVRTLEIQESPEARVEVALRDAAFSLPRHRTLTTGCGGGVTFFDLAAQREPVASSRRVTIEQVSGLIQMLVERASAEHRAVGGFHTSGLSFGDGLAVVASDIGRHNTLDKIAGECLLRGLPTQDAIVLTTGRVSTEMLGKAARMGAPVVVTVNSPTHLAIELARSWRVTLIGYARDTRMHIYTGWERIIGITPTL